MMKKLFYKSFLLFVLMIVTDQSLGSLFDLILKNSPDGRYYKIHYSLSECRDDLIIFGSSRAETNYATTLFRDSLQMSAWNTGRGGQGLPYWYAMQQGIMDNHTPKIAVINIESSFLSVNVEKTYERAGFLKPFYKNHPSIRPVINAISPFEKYFMYSGLYAYNSSFYYLLRPFFFSGLDGDREKMGWKTRDGVVKPSMGKERVVQTKRHLNPETKALFNAFISKFIEKKCKVFLVLSPDYKTSYVSTSTLEYLQNLENVILLDWDYQKVFNQNHQYFKDNNHLNTYGAVTFSSHICQQIKKNLQYH
jgi:hypothetical protein